MTNVLPIGSLLGVGTDAVMAADAWSITDGADAPSDMSGDDSNDVFGDEVFTTSGRSLGTVRDVIVGANLDVTVWSSVAFSG